MKRSIPYLSLPILLCLLMSSCDDSIEGCTDPNSINYNPNAEKNDGSCSYPDETKKVVCFFFTDSDNSTCGSFGINLLDQVKATNPVNTYFISVHPNGTDALFSPSGIDVASAFNVSGFPDFGVGDQNNLLNQSTILNAIQNESTESPLAGINPEVTVTTDSVIITMYGRFYTNDTSTYFAAAYLAEDNIISPQTGLSPTYSHQHVFRGSSGLSGIGTQINTLPISLNSSFKIRRSIYIQPGWNISNSRIIAVIWRQNGSDFEYVNAGD